MKQLREFNGHKAVFSFRVDLDYFHPEHVMNTLRVAEEHGISMTWFVNMQTGRFHASELRRIGRTQDVQNHAFEHATFGDEERNFANIMKADEILKRVGFDCRGFAAPFGHWNPALGRALELTGYSYSSEFREGGKIFPFHPLLEGKKASVLQVPVHPVCFGNLLEAGYTVGESVEYFARIIGLFYKKQIPVFLYCHPDGRLGKYPKLLDSILSAAKALDDTWFVNLTEYADFWKRKKFKEGESDWSDHSVFLENRDSALRKATRFYKGQLHRVDRKKIDRRLHNAK